MRVDRAARFSEIVGHRKILDALRDSITTAREARSYLFSGPEGVGKKSVALAFARGLNCQSGMIDGCRDCASCLRFDAATHPDLHLIEPEVKPGGVKNEISIEQIKTLIARLSFRPYLRGHKIVLIDRVDQMSALAANAFLKTLEEPPGATMIVLIATNPKRLPETILSRCREFKFNALSIEQSAQVISARLDLDAAESRKIAIEANGSLTRAFATSNRKASPIERIALSLLRGELAATEIHRLALEFDRAKDRAQIDETLDLIGNGARDLIALKSGGKCAKLVMRRDENLERAEARRYSFERLMRIYDLTEELKSARRWNLNPMTVFGVLAMEFNR